MDILNPNFLNGVAFTSFSVIIFYVFVQFIKSVVQKKDKDEKIFDLERETKITENLKKLTNGVKRFSHHKINLGRSFEVKMDPEGSVFIIDPLLDEHIYIDRLCPSAETNSFVSVDYVLEEGGHCQVEFIAHVPKGIAKKFS